MEELLRMIDDKSSLGIILALIIVFISIVTLWLLKRSPSKKNAILLLGICNSGKTSLFNQLVYKRSFQTLTSIIQNVGSALIEKTQTTKEKKFDVVDVPGHDKVRRKYFDVYKKNAKSLIFVIDSSTFTKDSKDVAQFFYEILTDEQISKSNLKVLVVCNKQDIEFSKGKSLVQSTLEKEIELLRKISSSTLKSTSETKTKANSSIITKNEDKPFEFKDLKYFKVDFDESSFLEYENIKKCVVRWIQLNVN